MRLIGLLACLLVGCGRQAGQREDCTAAVAAVKAKWMLKASSELVGAELDRAAEGMELGLTRHCNADAWSAETTACLKNIESRGQGCGDTLTADQKRELASDPQTRALLSDKDKE